ncbi:MULTISPECIES: SDR family oxidoreductase [unclassified Oleiphilus]|jgi:NAD(P)-dependent dehydrogenase (short-subunit alcohol dehydrogenase family)|nr:MULTISPECIES: SDR family oxidoreductase [unclassified Oleiphilus]KZY44820.1 short-chain dehydrogenase [Oleiphilus sp. HI0050]KZY75216.1 short-chain dehydrogenase [Oleiphilus sp. HI0069]KZY77088.1 short-chain dehydrogenase [Oleiphilus sp. HI0068]KZY88386.1 short-chain dehydrogenase [Oleiphilus sp. HI0072]KZZ08939.1 short-chain dehydrogenase [Oleiphilus sp. HI0078]KZZ19616.1 short-chain dehydrogenase [Oleiphilus sp. HI0081]KZZ45368.1 short-chain dehydrogenase [Oleiphilus sp. HI0085]
MSKNILVTGANRGIGLSFCQYYKFKGYSVYAVCREASEELLSLGCQIIAGIDVSKAEDVARLGVELQGVKLDLLINNAGILRDEVLGHIDYDQLEEQFRVNALGPLRVTEALLGNLDSGGKVAIITSRMGSIADNSSGGRYGYRMSKCALNIASVSLAMDLEDQGIAVGVFHPGLVGTEMIGGYGDITPDQAAERLAQRVDELNLTNTGTFWHSNGDVLPW